MCVSLISYYQATTTTRPQERHVYRNRECLTCRLLDVDRTPCSIARAVFSADLSYFAVTCSGPNVAYTNIIRTADVRNTL